MICCTQGEYTHQYYTKAVYVGIRFYIVDFSSLPLLIFKTTVIPFLDAGVVLDFDIFGFFGVGSSSQSEIIKHDTSVLYMYTVKSIENSISFEFEKYNI